MACTLAVACITACADGLTNPETVTQEPLLPAIVVHPDVHSLTISVEPDTVIAGSPDTIQVSISVDSTTCLGCDLAETRLLVGLLFRDQEGVPIQHSEADFLLSEIPAVHECNVDPAEPGRPYPLLACDAGPGHRLDFRFLTLGIAGVDTISVFAANLGEVGNMQDAFAKVIIEDDCDFFSEPVPDPLLNDPTVQQMLGDMWEASNPDDPALWEEQGGFIVDFEGELQLIEFESNAGGVICGAPFTGAEIVRIQAELGGVVLGHFHTHPHTHGVLTADYCPNPDDPYEYFGTGASPQDLNAARQADWPSYIVDAGQVHAMLPRHPEGQVPQTYQRNYCPGE